MDKVYIVFQDRELSCNSDIEKDGTLIIWDCDEIGRNLTTCQLIEKVGGIDNDIYQKVINWLYSEQELCYGEEDDLIDDMFEEVFELIEKQIGGGIFYKLDYQSVPFVKEVHKTEEGANNAVEYYNNTKTYKGRYSYCEYRVINNG